jgi:hypothetical protein
MQSTQTFNLNYSKYYNLKLAIWDLSGAYPHLWVHHYVGTQAIIYVIDGEKDAEIDKDVDVFL